MSNPIKTIIEDLTSLKSKAKEGDNIIAFMAYDIAISLVEPHISGTSFLQAEVEKWKGLYNLTEQQRKEWSETCIRKSEEVDRLKADLDYQIGERNRLLDIINNNPSPAR